MQVVVQQGVPPVTGEWRSECVDPLADFRRYFHAGPNESVPHLVGIGVLSDGDGTKTVVESDYADFSVSRSGACQ